MVMTSKNILLQAALQYAELGWRVVPLYSLNPNGICTCKAGADCGNPGKHPYVAWKDEQGTTQTGKIRTWWANNPNSGIGIITGSVSGILLSDFDGEEGRETLAKNEMPETVINKSGNGLHYLFAYPDEEIETNNKVRILPGMDIRGDGGLFVAPPTMHKSGRRYEWLNDPFATELAPCPQWLVEALKPKYKPNNGIYQATYPSNNRNYGVKALEGECEKVKQAQSGKRNQTLFIASCRMGELIAGGEIDEWEAETALVDAGKYTGLPDHEAKNTTKSGISRGKQNPRQAKVRPSVKFIYNIGDGRHVDSDTGQVWEAGDDTFLLEFSASDDGNARAFISLFGQEFVYTHAIGWLHFNGKYWDTEAAAESLKEKVIEVLIKRAATALKNLEKPNAKEVLKNSVTNTGKINACADLLCNKLISNIKNFDNQPDLLNCENGVVDLRTGELLPHNRDQFFTYCIPSMYKPNADFSLWDKYLENVLEDEWGEIREYLQMAIGYTLTGHTNEECLFYLYGATRAGKGTVTETLIDVLGTRLAAEVDFQTFSAKRDGDTNNFDLAPLKQVRAVFASESNRYQALNTAKIKALTGGNQVRCCFKHREHFNYRPQYKIWLSSNWAVNGDVDDDALWGRVRVISFPKSFLGREDKSLKAKLKTKKVLEGVLAWAVAGAKRWYELGASGLQTPEKVVKDTQAQRMEADYVQSWIDENLQLKPGHWESNSNLMNSYKQWCINNGTEPKHMRNFLATIKAKGFMTNVQKAVKGKVFKGVAGLEILETRDL